MKVIVTTSNRYLHLLPVFCFLFNKYWGKEQKVEIVGYASPKFPLLSNFNFVSLGTQGNVEDFSNDLRRYFEKQDEWFIWFMEDSFLTNNVDPSLLLASISLVNEIENLGRINLTNECIKQSHFIHGEIDHPTLGREHMITVHQNQKSALYRLSTQPSIWNKNFLLKYLTPNLTPWKFETQPTDDDYKVVGFDKENSPIKCNEGVRKYAINSLNLEGINTDYIEEMKKLGYLTNLTYQY